MWVGVYMCVGVLVGVFVKNFIVFVNVANCHFRLGHWQRSNLLQVKKNLPAR